MYLKTQGLVLRVTEYRDSDAILSVLTREQGLMTFKARGVRSRRSLNTTAPESWPAAMRFCVLWAVMIQNRSCARTNDWMPIRFVLSQTRMLWSSLLLRIRSSRGWNITQLTLFV